MRALTKEEKVSVYLLSVLCTQVLFGSIMFNSLLSVQSFYVLKQTYIQLPLVSGLDYW